MLSFHLSHIAGKDDLSFEKIWKNLFSNITKKQKTILSEKESSEMIEGICFLLPLIVTALAIVIMRILYNNFM